MADAGGQAQIELVAAVPLLAIAAAVVLQLMAVGYAQSAADGAAEAAAIAVAGGDRPAEAARRALPGWAQGRSRVDIAGGEVVVHLRPPALVPGLGRRLEVSTRAWVRPPSA